MLASSRMGPLVGLMDEDFPNITAWRKRVETRPAYLRAIAATEPEGCHDPKLFRIAADQRPAPVEQTR